MTRLSEMNRWGRDSNIHPLPLPEHGYILSDTQTKLLSVTSLVNMFFEGFNADLVIHQMRKSKKWGDNKYNGLSNEAIKKIWTQKGIDAATLGTQLHAAIECYYNSGDMGMFSHLLTSTEFAQFQRFATDFAFSRARGDCFIPYRTEWTVYDDSARIAGTIDMVYKNLGDNTYTLIDWKRCKTLKTTGNKRAKGVLREMRDCNFIRYSLQIGIYRYILENVYGLKIRDAFIVQLHPENENYQMVNVPTDSILYEVMVPRIIQALRRGNTSNGCWDLELASLLTPPDVPSPKALFRSDSWDNGTISVIRSNEGDEYPSTNGAAFDA